MTAVRYELRPNITLFELTGPFNSPEALSAARSRKSLKSSYLQLITDLEDRVSYFTLEIGSLGNFDQAAIRTLSDAFHFSKNEAKQVLKSWSKIVVSCTFFNARLSTSWDTTNLSAVSNFYIYMYFVRFFFVFYMVLSLLYFLLFALPSPSHICVGNLLT